MRDTDLWALTSYLLDQTPQSQEFINEITCALAVDSNGALSDSSILFGDRLVQGRDQYSQDVGSLKSIVHGDVPTVLKKVAKVFGLCVNVNIWQVGGEKDQSLAQKISDSYNVRIQKFDFYYTWEEWAKELESNIQKASS